MSEAVRMELDGGIAVITIDNPPVNAGSLAVRTGIIEAVNSVGADPLVDAAVLIGAGRSFIAGSDIREFSAPLADPQMPAVIAAIEGCPKPVVAALHGVGLGGGFEIALACDARIAAPGTKVGLPEVLLGIIPGAGGTVRVPRLTGVATAIGLIATGRRIGAEEALALGLIDRVADGDLYTQAVSFARTVTAKRNLLAAPVPGEEADAIEAAAHAALDGSQDNPAIAEAVEAVRRAAALPPLEAQAREREVFQRLRVSPEAAELRERFFAERRAARQAKAANENGRG